jgi:type VI secretion system protein ImpA
MKMDQFEDEQLKIDRWLLPLDDEAAPCGPDLEYDNEFLAITQAAAGKPESQFGPAEAPAWREVLEMADSLLDRSHDLRIAILWMRASLSLHGYAILPLGLTLVNGLIESQWDALHPLPDDGDQYARANALAVLREVDGLIGDLRLAVLIEDRSVGRVTVRAVELALGLAPALNDEEVMSKERLAAMLAAAIAKSPDLKQQCLSVQALTRQLMALVSDKLSSDLAPDLRPLWAIVNGLVNLLASDAPGNSSAPVVAESSDPSHVGFGSRQGLSGTVNSREDAIHAIEMICSYLERTEPANPAPLFLRRGAQLINQNFLQLMKMLAPEALSGVAGLVGIDPSTVDPPPDEY